MLLLAVFIFKQIMIMKIYFLIREILQKLSYTPSKIELSNTAKPELGQIACLHALMQRGKN